MSRVNLFLSLKQHWINQQKNPNQSVRDEYLHTQTISRLIDNGSDRWLQLHTHTCCNTPAFSWYTAAHTHSVAPSWLRQTLMSEELDGRQTGCVCNSAGSCGRREWLYFLKLTEAGRERRGWFFCFFNFNPCCVLTEANRANDGAHGSGSDSEDLDGCSGESISRLLSL